MNTLESNTTAPAKGLLVIGCVLASFSSMRMLLPSIYQYICILYLLLFLFLYLKDRKSANTFAIMALYSCVDNGGLVYNETASLVRYICYAVLLSSILINCTYSKKRLLILLSLAIFYLISSIVNETQTNTQVLIRDLFLFSVFSIVFVIHPDRIQHFRIHVDFLAKMLFTFVIFEGINVVFYDPSVDYLSYNTTKSLVVLIFFAFMATGWIKASTAFLLVISILVLYVTRMIILTFLLVLALYAFIKFFNFKRFFKMALYFGCLLVGISILSQNFDLHKIKLIGTLAIVFENFSGFESIKLLDPVRYYETLAFVDTGVNLLLGNGFGSGVYDQHGYFSFVGINDFAFSKQELKSGYFYNFHDVWVDIGFRFGLIFLFLLYFEPFRKLNHRSTEVRSLAMTLIVIITCAFYSMTGIILIAFIYLAFLGSIKGSRDSSA